MKNLEKYLINFDELKAGDTVWSPLCGEIRVTQIVEEDDYPIKTEVNSFTKNGFFVKSNKFPSIYKSNPFLDLKEEPRMIEVRVGKTWYKHELLTIKNGIAVCWNNANSLAFTSKDWREIQPKELTEKEEIELLKKRISELENRYNG